MFCPKCANEIGEGMAFCQHCGAPLNTSQTDSVKNVASSFFRSFQEKAKNVGESFNSINEKPQGEKKETPIEPPSPNASQKNTKQYTTKSYTGEQQGRFKEDIFSNGLFSYCGAVIVDRLTGVNYLFAHRGDCGGLTVLVDENGKSLVTKEDKIETDLAEDN